MRIDELKAKAITEAEFDKLAEKKDACYHKVKQDTVDSSRQLSKM